MPHLELDDTEFGTLMFILANAEFRNGVTWGMVNPLIMKFGTQARLQKEHQADKLGDGKEARHERTHSDSAGH